MDFTIIKISALIEETICAQQIEMAPYRGARRLCSYLIMDDATYLSIGKWFKYFNFSRLPFVGISLALIIGHLSVILTRLTYGT